MSSRPGERQGAGTALPITDDSAGEGNEAFKLTMTDVSQGAALPIEVKQGTTVTIIDNDSNAAAVTAHDGTGLEAINAVVPVHEGDGNRIVFALGAAPSSPVTVGYRIRRPDRDLAISGATSPRVQRRQLAGCLCHRDRGWRRP